MSVLLLRHVDAGDRAAWSSDDRSRPATARGTRQAAALVELLTAQGPPIVAVWSSPYARCVASVSPLAEHLGVVVEEVDELAEGTPPDVVGRLLRRAARVASEADGAVVACSHGDVIGDVVLGGDRAGHLGDAEPRWPKASTWVVDDAPDTPRMHYLAPPSVE